MAPYLPTTLVMNKNEIPLQAACPGHAEPPVLEVMRAGLYDKGKEVSVQRGVEDRLPDHRDYGLSLFRSSDVGRTELSVGSSRGKGAWVRDFQRRLEWGWSFDLDLKLLVKGVQLQN